MTSSRSDDVMMIEQSLPSPWNFQQLQEELDKNHAWQYVARFTETNSLLGYIFGSSVVGEAEILKIAASAKHRRQGLGTQLLSFAFQRMQEHKVTCCFLELRESNVSAFKFYIKNGFQQVGLRKSYYTNPPEDAMIMKTTQVGRLWAED